MKGLRLLFTILLAPLAFYGAAADDAADIARAATRRNNTSTTSATRKPSTVSDKKNNTQYIPATASRTTNITKNENTVRERTTTDTTNQSRSGNVIYNSGRTDETNTPAIAPRNNPKVQPRYVKPTDAPTVRVRTATTTTRARTGNTPAAATPQTRNAAQQIARTASAATHAGKSRARSTTATGTNIMQRNFSKCRTVFYDCMDEFCANKDNVLKRCACSARINEFDNTKKSMAQVEDKLLEFNQRLLTVSMDKEDTQALNQATEGELAFATKDQSESKKMLDEIAKKLNSSFDDNNFNQGLNAISLSLNTDAAFDTVDSWAGASTTAKSGTALYASALPVCREMALEVCTPDDLAIAESGYQVTIEHDCNTVKKSYQNQADQARQQIFESGALLDISRLNTYQQRNADDILTCKKKMLDMLTDPSVCGDNMGKCLDTTGRYIDPSTGEAFLTTELANLGNLISRPNQNQTWSSIPSNAPFITYLNSKKIFLEPAMENCENISDYVWKSFIEDALSQIKLAQEAKLEEMRQACTTLTTKCLDETADSISKFDSRALSIFGIAADKTVNSMCADIKNACTALLNTSGDGTGWDAGITAIANQKTYDTIISTCREIGRTCITQACTSVSGSFGLCEDIDKSINRKSIINRTTCWNDVVQCVASAGESALTQIQQSNPLEQILPLSGNSENMSGTTENKYAYYPSLYGISQYETKASTIYNDQKIISSAITEINSSLDNMSDIITACSNYSSSNCVHDICATECTGDDAGNKTVSNACYTCRLAERIWGNCEVPSTTVLNTSTAHNKIKRPLSASGGYDDEGTLLSWFAKNTGTLDKKHSCRASDCADGLKMNAAGQCVEKSRITESGEDCPINEQWTVIATPQLRNCCPVENKHFITDSNGNCCHSGKTATLVRSQYYFDQTNQTDQTDQTKVIICTNKENATPYLIASTNEGDIICIGDVTWENTDTATETYPNGTTIQCNGTLIRITSGYYFAPNDTSLSTYINQKGQTCYATTTSEQNWETKYNEHCEAPDKSTIRFK